MIFKQHLLKDGYSSGIDYQQEFEGAPIYSIWDEANKHNWYFDHKAAVIADAIQWNKKHPRRHKKAEKKYRRKHHDRELDRGRKWRENNRKAIAEAKHIRKTALPDDWPTRSELWVFVGLILRRQEYMSNEELAARLDASGGPACSYSEDESWDIITRPGPAANLDY